MKRIILLLVLLCSLAAAGQNLRKWSSDSTTNTLWGDWFYRVHPTYSWSADALKLADYRLVKDSSLFDMYRIPGIDSIYFVRGGTVFAIKDSAGSAGTTYTFQHSLTESGGTVNLVNDEASPGNLEYYGTNSGGTKGYFPLSTTAFLNGGNSFGATATIGTNDNFGLEVELNNIVKHRFHPDGTLSLNLTSDVTQILYVNGASRFNGVLNIENNFGLSALSGAAMANFGANGPTTSVTWALNNNYINANTTKNYFRIAADAESNTSTTQTINQLLINPTYNNTSGTSTMRGIYYNPTLTAVTGTTNIAFENTSGFIRLRTLPTGYGAYTILVHNPDSNVAQVPASTFATQSALNDTAAALRADFPAGGGGLTSVNSETGPNIAINATNGIGVATSTNTVTVSLGGTLNTATQILGASQSLTIGTSGSKISNYSMHSADDINLNADDRVSIGAALALKVNVVTDADFTVTTNMISIVLKGDLSNNRTLTLPSVQQGMLFIVHNHNSNVSFTWNISGTLHDKENNTVTSLADDSVYMIQGIDDGTSTYWKIISIY